jgi:hypothetical protein
MKASHKRQWASIRTGRGTKEIKLLPGQFIFGRNQAAKELKMAASTVRNRMALLRKLENLALKEDTHYSLVSIVNWPTYQDGERNTDRQQDNQRTTKGHIQERRELEEGIPQHAEGIYLAYPRKADRENTVKSISKILKAGIPSETLLRAVQNYRSHIERKGTDREYVVQSNNFFGRAARWEEWQDRDPAEPGEERPEGRAYQPFRGDV